MSWRFACILLCLSVTPLRAQNFGFAKYGFNQGLHHAQIGGLAQDSYGNLLVLPTTGNPLYRFDGRDFQRFPVSIEGIDDNFKLYVIRADKHENIWLLTSIGLVRFDGRKFFQFPSETPMKVSRRSTLYLDENSHPWIIDDEKNIFFMHDSAFSRFEYKGLMTGVPMGISEFNGEVFSISSKSELISLPSGKPITLPWLDENEKVRMIFRDENDYLALVENEIVYHNRLRSDRTTFKYGSLDPTKIGDALYFNDSLLVLSGNTISLLDKQGNHPIEGSSGFNNGLVLTIFKDRSNSIWLGTDSQGIIHLAKQQLVNIPMPDNDVSVTTYPLDKNRILSGTYQHGLVEIDGHRVRSLGLRGIDGEIVMTTVKGPGNTILIGTQKNGAFALRPGNKITKVDMGAVDPKFVLPISTFNDEVWMASLYGLHRFSGSLSNIENYSYRQLGVSSYFNAIYEYNNILLMGSSEEGLFSFDPRINKLTKTEGSEGELVIYTIKSDNKGNVWVGGEFPRLLVMDSQLKRVAQIDLSKYCSNVLTFELLNESQLLVGSNDGVLRISLAAGYKISSVRKLGPADGYNGGEIAMSSMHRVDNKIWFGTVDGVYCYTIDGNTAADTPPYTFIKDIRLFNQETNWRNYTENVEGLYGLPKTLELDHDSNNLTFSFYANDFYNNPDLQFHYWLEGLETGWSEYSKVENITYSSLNPGKYTFKVQSNDGINAGNVASLSFVILPAFWQTWTFFALCAVIAAVAVVVLIRVVTLFRIRRFRLREQIRTTEIVRLRKQMAMDFHDEMGNKLASVLAYSSSLKLMSKSKENYELFDYFEKNAAAIYYGTKDFIWSIDVDSNNLREVIVYLRDFGVNFFEKNRIEFYVENDILKEDFSRLLPDGNNRQIVLLFKEAMTNVLKHASASKVYFDVVISNGLCRITLEDNGVGIQRNGDVNGKGMKSMADRASKITGHLEVGTKDPHGTRVILEFKV